jgi:hypothetical protein
MVKVQKLRFELVNIKVQDKTLMFEGVESVTDNQAFCPCR